MEAVDRYGVLRGGLMAMWRVLRCHPFVQGRLRSGGEVRCRESKDYGAAQSRRPPVVRSLSKRICLNFNNPQQEPGMERRLLLVFALTFLVIILFQPLLKKYLPQPAAPPRADSAASPVSASAPPRMQPPGRRFPLQASKAGGG